MSIFTSYSIYEQLATHTDSPTHYLTTINSNRTPLHHIPYWFSFPPSIGHCKRVNCVELLNANNNNYNLVESNTNNKNNDNDNDNNNNNQNEELTIVSGGMDNSICVWNSRQEVPVSVIEHAHNERYDSANTSKREKCRQLQHPCYHTLSLLPYKILHQ